MVFWYRRISRSATVPGLYLLGGGLGTGSPGWDLRPGGGLLRAMLTEKLMSDNDVFT